MEEAMGMPESHLNLESRNRVGVTTPTLKGLSLFHPTNSHPQHLASGRLLTPHRTLSEWGREAWAPTSTCGQSCSCKLYLRSQTPGLGETFPQAK